VNDTSLISWTEATWNPASGCTKISPGCEHCYIERTPPLRFAGRRFTEARHGTYVGASTGVQLHPGRLTTPLRWARPRRIFTGSLTDLVHTDIPQEYLAQVFAVMAATPRHTYQVLTKRPARMRAWLAGPAEQAVRAVLDEWTHTGLHPTPTSSRVWRPSNALPETLTWPLPNVWVGVTAETQHWAHRIPILLDTPAVVRWVSAEPLLAPLTLHKWLPNSHGKGIRWNPHPTTLTGTAPVLDWVVAGGESGPHARPTHPDWIRALRDECAATGTPFHFKQWGEWTPTPHEATPQDEGPVGMVRVGKRAAGRTLDGRIHDAYPHPDQEAA
jgi:protein gp37